MKRLAVSITLLMLTPLALAASAVQAAPQESPPQVGLAQCTSHGHVLGFDSGGYFLSNGTYALRVSFEGAKAVAPAADETAEGTRTPVDTMSRPDGSSANKAAPLSRVSYSDLWPGVSVTYDAPGSGIARSTWTLAPGADPAAIRLRYNRAAAATTRAMRSQWTAAATSTWQASAVPRGAAPCAPTHPPMRSPPS